MNTVPDVNIREDVNIQKASFIEGLNDRYVDWGAILAGALLATVISLILTTFGTAIGLSFGAGLDGDIPAKWLAIAVGSWMIWTAVSSSAAGGYFAGRMRKPAGDATPEEVDTRDGAHGVAVWAVATLLTVVLAAAGVGGAIKSAAAVAGAAAAPMETLMKDNVDYLVGVSLRNGSALPSDRARAEIASVLVRSLQQDQVSATDRNYLAQVVASDTGIDRAEASRRVDAMIAEAEQVRATVAAAARQARIFGLIGAFVLAASLLVAGAAAYFAAVLGGDHRTRNIGFATFRASSGGRL